MAAMAAAHGGEVPQKFADGGLAEDDAQNADDSEPTFAPPEQMSMPQESFQAGQAATGPVSGPMSNAGKVLTGGIQAPPHINAVLPDPDDSSSGGSSGGSSSSGMSSMAMMAMMAAKGGKVPEAQNKKPVVGEELAAKGKVVPGKAKVNHDSYANDNVKALLSPGEVVLPLHIMNSADPAKAAAEFVTDILRKKAKGKK